MHRLVIGLLCLALATPLVVAAADPESQPEPAAVPAAPAPESIAPERTEPAPSVVTPPPLTPKAPPKPRAASKPATVPAPPQATKPAEKPHTVVENAAPRNAVADKPVVEVPPPAAAPPPHASTGNSETEPPVATGYSIGCLALSFAMLIIGFAAGFLGRHLLSRHKLGGMTVRIGTWRGIP
jgi:outer membrane biosynthesis protein TonB